MTRSEVARAAGVAGPAVSNWARRYPDFPAALQKGDRVGYPAAAVAQWLDGRVIPRDELGQDEHHGRTYGDRFRAAVGLTAPRLAAVAADGRAAADILDERVWAPLEGLLRASAEPARFEAAVLSLVCLRGVDPAGWAAVSTASAEKIREVLTQVRTHLSEQLETATAALRDAPPAGQRLRRIVDILTSDQTADAELFEFLLDRFARHRHRSSDEYLTPSDIAWLMVRMLDPRPRDSVLDPCCGAGTLLTTAARHIRDAAGLGVSIQSTGRAATARTWSLAAMNAALHDLAIHLDEAPTDDPRQVDTPEGQFDVVLLNPPFGMKAWSLPAWRTKEDWRYGEPSPHNAAFAWLQTAVEALAPDGRAAVIMPYSATSARTSREHTIRTSMIEDGVVRCVMALPSNLFRETTSSVTVWILAHRGQAPDRDVLLIDARSAFDKDGKTHRTLTQDGRRAIVGLYRNWCRGSAQLPVAGAGWSATTASLEEIREQRYDLQPVTYLAQRRRGVAGTQPRPSGLMPPTDAIRSRPAPAARPPGTVDTLIGAVPDDWQALHLDEWCEVQPGPSGSVLATDEYVIGGVPVISASDITVDGISPGPAASVRDETARRLHDRYRVRQGDILLVRVGATTRFAMATQAQDNWLIGSSCLRIRIRPDRDLDPAYLSCYLAHPAVQEWLVERTGRGVIPTLSKERVAELPVVLPPAAVQKDLADSVRLIDEQITACQDAIRAARARREQLLPGLLPNRDPREAFRKLI